MLHFRFAIDRDGENLAGIREFEYGDRNLNFNRNVIRLLLCMIPSVTLGLLGPRFMGRRQHRRSAAEPGSTDPAMRNVMSESTTVDSGKLLSEMLGENMGVCHWVACTNYGGACGFLSRS
jgi:hypothetical protein